ncbi:3-phosphoshikimate 1-carboxyvinyltransferase [Bdellovibrio bacteriovorus]|uniref:3-phosphoshikimate 1-carboxyvinyltransferase n=1 Tax=Bdellovibrio bacteriovorus TaxID=959 RepID=A0A150WPK6_BDEBC|nr:3-phosphoshikimate 1-carboxyvinyltransferase [Bdellovibrio bacteriovorus]KYG66296.1 3-phosphoshikimate 1-carboxyvinyltransferase [Bdellovibrio bacteriovorus]
MNKFYFQGDIPGSKSIFNRALIVKSFFPVLDLHGFSNCDDVRHMREGLKIFRDRNRIDCGEGGTTFRFMALRVSRQKGVHTLEATARLMQRPKGGLLALLKQLGVQAKVKGNELFIMGEGWKRPRNPIFVDTSESSQYASALVLNAWLLDFDLEFELTGDKVSESYFELTLEMVKEMGMRIKKTERGYLIPSGQRISKLEWTVEPDLSSGFTMAAAGALAGEVTINNFPEKSSQPDLVFLDVFKKMNIDFTLAGHILTVKQTPSMKSVDVDLFQSPDLFPVLAVVCSWAHGVSKLHGAPHLALKESNRIQRVADLFKLLDVQHEVLPDGMIIHGNPQQKLKKNIRFNPDQDHRMVMAAALMKLKGHDIHVEDPHVINKSFPEFWGMIGLTP